MIDEKTMERAVLPAMMRKLRKIWLRHETAILTGVLRLFIYVVLAGLFFGLMAINNWQIRHMSRTLATMLLTYTAMSVAMHAVYGGYAVGKKKSKPIISSMSLATLATDAVTYLQLQIMNVNEENNSVLRLFGPDFPWLLVCMAAQVVLIFFWVRLGNNFYFTINPPKHCLVILGNPEEKESICRKIGVYKLQWKVERVIMWNDPRVQKAIRQTEVVFLGSLPSQAKLDILQMCYDQRKDVLCKAQLQDIMLSNATQVVVDDAPFLEMAYGKMTLGQRILKRLIDIGFSALVLVVLSPVLLIIAICIKLDDGGPVLFRQQRMTVAGRKFTICKFRTMRQEEPGKKQVSAALADDRITRVGQVLRRFRLDELPQFWNILVGDMTLVGPRPEMLENVEKYKLELPAFAYREKMKAGLTGYAQIEGRYNTTPQDKLMLDLMYIESFSIWMDVKLIFRTMTVFFKKDSTQGFDPADIQDDTQTPLGA